MGKGKGKGKGKGVPHDPFDARPVIGICNTTPPASGHWSTILLYRSLH